MTGVPSSKSQIRVVKKKINHPWVEKIPDNVPSTSKTALRSAMTKEGIKGEDYDDLLWIMAQESEGTVDKRNKHSTARGLFQLLKNHYDLNPHGEASFGNAVEECQGGIRYIYGRYGTAENAKAFWKKNLWY